MTDRDIAPDDISPPPTASAVPPTFPAGRYGRRREPRPARRWLTALLALATAVGLGAIGYRLYSQYGDHEFTPLIVGETERTDDRVTIRLQVRSRSGREPAHCFIRASAESGLVVGTAEVVVPAGRRVTGTYTVVTSQRTFAVDVAWCRTAAGDQ